MKSVVMAGSMGKAFLRCFEREDYHQVHIGALEVTFFLPLQKSGWNRAQVTGNLSQFFAH